MQCCKNFFQLTPHASLLHLDTTIEMEFPYVVANAFTRSGATDPSTTGNPAAVVVLTDNLVYADAESDYQKVASELGYSETAFVRKIDHDRDDGLVDYSIRWFTPTCEIGLCGHASMASAAAILEREAQSCRGVHFVYAKGELEVTTSEGGGMYEMSMTKSAPERVNEEVWTIAKVREAFGDASTTPLGATFSASKNSIGDTFLLVDARLSTEETFEAIRAAYMSNDSLKSLRPIEEIGGRGVCVVLTTPAGEPNQYFCRWFGPLVGIDEDPVTGSACAGVAPLLSRTITTTSTDGWFHGIQSSARSGEISCRVDDNRVRVRGACSIVSRGVVNLPKSLAR